MGYSYILLRHEELACCNNHFDKPILREILVTKTAYCIYDVETTMA